MEIEESAEEEEAGTRAARPSGKTEKQPWPKTLAKQVEAVRGALESSAQPITAAGLARQFQRGNKERIAEILETLVALGKARENEDGRFQA